MMPTFGFIDPFQEPRDGLKARGASVIDHNVEL